MRNKTMALFTIALTFLCLTASVQAYPMTRNFYDSWDFRSFYYLSDRMVNDLGSGLTDAIPYEAGNEPGDGMVSVSMEDTSLLNLENTFSNEEAGTLLTTGGIAPTAENNMSRPTNVPEPSTGLLVATGIASLAVAWLGRKSK